RALDASFEELDTLDLVMSDYLSESEVRGISVAWEPVSEPLVRVLRESLVVARGTSGAFDPTLGRLTKLWRRAFRKGEIPKESSINEALEMSGYENLLIEENSDGVRVRLGKPGILIDLGGIGKGFAMAELGSLLNDEFNISSFLIDGGGDVFAGDMPPGKSGWKVEVRGNGAPLCLEVANVAVMTSGDLHNYAEMGGKRFSHVLDPKSGKALEGSASATVIMANPARADALASALCVVGSRAKIEDSLEALAPEAAFRVSKAGKRKWEKNLRRFKTAVPDPQDRER
ncbi:FAD:protein FMN transferase, partial [Verrucomicrobiales bacterium]|nr:FAD:protein FMN transferase [Verrucomicrobiales bacterium]